MTICGSFDSKEFASKYRYRSYVTQDNAEDNLAYLFT